MTGITELYSILHDSIGTTGANFLCDGEREVVLSDDDRLSITEPSVGRRATLGERQIRLVNVPTVQQVMVGDNCGTIRLIDAN